MCVKYYLWNLAETASEYHRKRLKKFITKENFGGSALIERDKIITRRVCPLLDATAKEREKIERDNNTWYFMKFKLVFQDLYT